jgi:hypothetical protein
MGEAKRRANSSGLPPQGTLVLNNLEPLDVTFASDEGIAWNVSRLLRDCEAGRIGKLGTFPVVDAYLQNRAVSVDAAKVERYRERPDILARPLLAVMRHGTAWLVDGHHRLRAMKARGWVSFVCWLVTEAEAGPRYQCRAFVVPRPGATPEDVSHLIWPELRGPTG